MCESLEQEVSDTVALNNVRDSTVGKRGDGMHKVQEVNQSPDQAQQST